MTEKFYNDAEKAMATATLACSKAVAAEMKTRNQKKYFDKAEDAQVKRDDDRKKKKHKTDDDDNDEKKKSKKDSRKSEQDAENKPGKRPRKQK